jgi:hypothetical protein
LGVRCTAASIGRAQAQRDAAPAFSPHRSVVLSICVVVVARLARRTKSHSTRNRPALAPSGYRSDLEISISWSLARWTPAHRPRDPPTDPRDGAREFSLGCTTHPRRAAETRHHGLAGHSIAIYADVAKGPSLTGMADIYKEPRDCHGSKLQFQRAQLGSRSPFSSSVSIVRLRVSPFNVCRCTRRRSIGLRCLANGPSTPWSRSSSACLVYQNCNSDYQIYGAGVSIPAGHSQGRSFEDRSNSRLTHPHTS